MDDQRDRPPPPSDQWGQGYPPPPQAPQYPQQPYPMQHQQQYPGHYPQGYPQQQPYYQHQQPYQPPQQQIFMMQQTAILKAPFNHGIHIVLDVLTCGVWIPVHIICALAH